MSGADATPSHARDNAYHRVDVRRLGTPASASATEVAAGDATRAPAGRVRWWVVLPLSLLLCAGITVLTVFAANISGGTILGATLIPVTAYGILFGLVLLVNPILRLISARRAWISRRELTCIFAAMLVAAGIPGYGMAHQLVPLMATPHNPDWNTAQRGWDDELLPHLPDALFIQNEQAIRAFYLGQATDANGTPIQSPPANASWSRRLSHGWHVATSIRWGQWMIPLLAWSVFLAASYALFYSLVYVVLPAWSQREKLIFPLARIPESLLPEEGARRGVLPPLLRDSGFWAAFVFVFAILSFNAGVNSELLPALGQVPLGMGGKNVQAMLDGSLLDPITGSAGQMSGLKFLITFTVIGIGFLLPSEVSFSAWSYYLAGLGVILVLTWLGYGQAMADFPTEWYWMNNPVTALGGGALLMFAAVMLVRAIGDYVRYRGATASWWSLKLGAPGMTSVASLFALWAWLSWVGLPVLWAGLFLAVLVLILTGLLRIVAESGVFWTQLHVSFFHLYRTFGLGRWLNAVAIIPMLPVYWVLYLDVKAFAGSNILNAAKMEQDTAGDANDKAARHSRRIYHLNLILTIAFVAIGSVLLLLVLTHVNGGYQMNRWFFNGGPPSMFDRAVSIATSEPAMQWGNAMWYGIGAGYLLLSLRLRRTLFWWPHPIGLVMLCNPLMAQLWFSFFIGWICKRTVVKYGGKATFDKARGMFLGLIIGEIIAVLAWTLLGITTELTPNLTLNRHS